MARNALRPVHAAGIAAPQRTTPTRPPRQSHRGHRGQRRRSRARRSSSAARPKRRGRPRPGRRRGRPGAPSPVGFLTDIRQALETRRVSSTILTATGPVRDVLLNYPDGWEVEQPWLWSSPGINGPFTIGNPIPGAAHGSNLASIPAVARCTAIIVDSLAGMPWKVYRGRDQLPTPDWIADPQALRLDGRVLDPAAVPDVRLSHVDFWSNWLTDALWWGDGLIWAPNRDSAGAPRPPMALIHPFDWQFRERAYYVGERAAPGRRADPPARARAHHRRPRHRRVPALRRRARLHAHDQGLRPLGVLRRRPVGLPQGQQGRPDPGARGRAQREVAGQARQRQPPGRGAECHDRLHAADVVAGRRGAQGSGAGQPQRDQQRVRRPRLLHRGHRTRATPTPTSRPAARTS